MNSESHFGPLVERVVKSRYFSKSARLRDMLLYLAGRVLHDGVTEIHEQEVGHRVFGRQPDYDTATDNIVRVHASTLRKRLEQYFAGEGADEPFIIELPKGNYAPVFRRRAAPPEPPVAPQPVGEAEPPAPSHLTSWRLLWVLMLGMVLGAGALWVAGWRTAEQEPPLLKGRPALQRFWGGIFRPGQRTDLVLDDAAIGLYQEMTGRAIGLSSYFDRSYLRGLDELGATLRMGRGAPAAVVQKRMSSFAQVNALWRLAAIAAAAGAEASPVFARDYSFQALGSHNAVLFGDRHTNPWVEPFEASIGVRWKSYPGADGYYPIDTLAPESAREQFRAPADRRQAQDGYALVVLAANLRGTGRVLWLSATGGTALGVASEFLTDEGSLARLGSRLPGGAKDEPFPAFEALLRIPGRSRRVHDVGLVVCRPVTSRPTQPN